MHNAPMLPVKEADISTAKQEKKCYLLFATGLNVNDNFVIGRRRGIMLLFNYSYQQ